MAALGNGLTYRPPPPRFRADSFIDLGFNTLTFSRDLQDWNNPPGFSSSPPPPPLPPPPRAPVLSESGGLLLSPLSAKNLTVKKKKKRFWGGGRLFLPVVRLFSETLPPRLNVTLGNETFVFMYTVTFWGCNLPTYPLPSASTLLHFPSRRWDGRVQYFI